MNSYLILYEGAIIATVEHAPGASVFDILALARRLLILGELRHNSSLDREQVLKMLKTSTVYLKM